MANEELVKYVQSARAQGMSDDEISHKLLEQGWQKEDVDKAMHTSPATPTTTPHGTSKSEGGTVWGVLAIIFAIVFAPVGIVLGIVALKKGSKVMGIIAIVLGTLSFVVLFIGYLAYFAVLSPTTLLPERCTFPIQVSCNEYRVEGDSILLMLQNGAGSDLIVESIEISGEHISGSCALEGQQFLWGNGVQNTFTVSSCTIVNPQGYEKGLFDITITYARADSASISHTFNGELYAALP